MVLPWGLVPKRRITVRAPESRQSHSGCFRENRRKLRRDIIVESFARSVGCNLDVVSSARELELIHRSRAQRRGQLDRETATWLIPIRTQRREWRVAPE